ncbi:MAG: hypothetical protein QOD77_796 [Thermoplasmata archaeon]|nr:hypothetical protein [Thermoplasmata archaeon]
MVETYSPSHARFDARANLWWLIAAIGLALMVLAFIIQFFNGLDDYRDEEKASMFFQMLGVVGLTGGLALGALFMTGASWGIRLAMLLGAALVLVGITGVLPPFR